MMSADNSTKSDCCFPVILSVGNEKSPYNGVYTNDDPFCTVVFNRTLINSSTSTSTKTGGASLFTFTNSQDSVSVLMCTFEKCCAPDGFGGAIGINISHPYDIQLEFNNDLFYNNCARCGKDIFIYFEDLDRQVKQINVQLHLSPPYFVEENSIMGTDRTRNDPILLIPFFKHQEYDNVVVSKDGNDDECLKRSTPCSTINVALNVLAKTAHSHILVKFGVVTKQAFVSDCTFSPVIQQMNYPPHSHLSSENAIRFFGCTIKPNEMSSFTKEKIDELSRNYQSMYSDLKEEPEPEFTPIISFDPSEEAMMQNETLLLLNNTVKFFGIAFQSLLGTITEGNMKTLITVLKGFCTFHSCSVTIENEGQTFTPTFLEALSGSVTFNGFELRNNVVSSNQFFLFIDGEVSINHLKVENITFQKHLLRAYPTASVTLLNTQLNSISIIDSSLINLEHGPYSVIGYFNVFDSNISSVVTYSTNSVFFRDSSSLVQISFLNCSFENNKAEINEYGGLMSVSIPSNGAFFLTSCSINGSLANYSFGKGGGIYILIGGEEFQQISEEKYDVDDTYANNGENGLTPSIKSKKKAGYYFLYDVDFQRNHAKYGFDIFINCSNFENQVSYRQFQINFLATLKDTEHSVEGCQKGSDEIVSLYQIIHRFLDGRIYVNDEGTDDKECGNQTNKCQSLNAAVTHLIPGITTGEISVCGTALLTNSLDISNSKIISYYYPQVGILNARASTEFYNDSILATFDIMEFSNIAFHISEPEAFYGKTLLMTYGKMLNVTSCQLSISSSYSSPVGFAVFFIAKGKVFITKFNLQEIAFKSIPFMFGQADIEIDQLNVSSVSVSNSSLFNIYKLPSNLNIGSIILSNSFLSNVTSLVDAPSILSAFSSGTDIIMRNVTVVDCDQMIRSGSMIEICSDNVLTITDCKFIGSCYIPSSNIFFGITNFNRDQLIDSTENHFPIKGKYKNDEGHHKAMLPTDFVEKNTESEPFVHPMCFISSSLISSVNSTFVLNNTLIANSSCGGISIESSTLSITNCSFSSNYVGGSVLPQLRQNIRCDNGGNVIINSLDSGDGTLNPVKQDIASSLSLWFFNNNCSVNGDWANHHSSTYFIPTITNASCTESSLTEIQSTRFIPSAATSQLEVVVHGTDFVPCGLSAVLRCGDDLPEKWVNVTIRMVNSSSLLSFSIDSSMLKRLLPNSQNEQSSKFNKIQNISIALIYISSSIVQSMLPNSALSANGAASDMSSFYSITPFVPLISFIKTPVAWRLIVIIVAPSVLLVAIVIFVVICLVRRHKKNTDFVQQVTLGPDGLFKVFEAQRKDVDSKKKSSKEIEEKESVFPSFEDLTSQKSIWSTQTSESEVSIKKHLRTTNKKHRNLRKERRNFSDESDSETEINEAEIKWIPSTEVIEDMSDACCTDSETYPLLKSSPLQ